MIPLVDLTRQYRTIKEEIDQAISQIVEKGENILGEEVTNFETDFAKFVGTKFCIGVASGYDALTLSLIALGVKKGDEVIAPANTFVATILGASHLGVGIKLVDVDRVTYNLDVSKIGKLVTSKTKVIIPVHLHGQPADMGEIGSLAQNRGLAILEDAAQAHGASIDGRHVGTFGQLAAFSFYPGKNLGAFGDGGAILTNDSQIDQLLRTLRNVGQEKKYLHSVKGFNSRLDTLQAAVLRVKLKHLNTWNIQRQQVAHWYQEDLKDSGVVLPSVSQGNQSVWHQFVIQVTNREKLIEKLKESGIATGIHYPIPIHLQPAFKDLGYKSGDFPVTENLSSKILSLPMFPELTREEVTQVTAVIKNNL